MLWQFSGLNATLSFGDPSYLLEQLSPHPHFMRVRATSNDVRRGGSYLEVSPHFSPPRYEAAFVECGDLSPLLLAATRRGESTAADSTVEKAGASSLTPKLAIPANCWRGRRRT